MQKAECWDSPAATELQEESYEKLKEWKVEQRIKFHSRKKKMVESEVSSDMSEKRKAANHTHSNRLDNKNKKLEHTGICLGVLGWEPKGRSGARGVIVSEFGLGDAAMMRGLAGELGDVRYTVPGVPGPRD
jgi:hypothetical protein